MIYHSYPDTGYETGPAEIGLAWCKNEDLLQWHCLSSPVLSWKDGSDWEKGGLYKACILYHNCKYYMFYNAKTTDERWIEQTGLATSTDLLHWTRCESNPVLPVSSIGNWDCKFVSDPYIVRDHDTWINFFFGYDYEHAQEGVAFSEDLIHWEKILFHCYHVAHQSCRNLTVSMHIKHPLCFIMENFITFIVQSGLIKKTILPATMVNSVALLLPAVKNLIYHLLHSQAV